MKLFCYFVSGALLFASCLVAMIVFAPQKMKHLLGDCEQVTLREHCLGFSTGTVLGEWCGTGKTVMIRGTNRQAETGVFSYGPRMFGAVEAFRRSGCSIVPTIPGKPSPRKSEQEVLFVDEYRRTICDIDDTATRRVEIDAALERFGVTVECRTGTAAVRQARDAR